MRESAYPRALALGALIVAGLVGIACEQISPSDKERTSISPSAKLETLAMLKEDLAAPRHPSDGGGSAWLEGDVQPVSAGSTATFRIVYEAGPDGIDEGGGIYLVPSPFWGWSGAHARSPRQPGFTTVVTKAVGVELEARSPDGQMLVVTVGGRRLEAGEQVVLEYGAGPAGAIVDRYAEGASRLWLAVDGDGDGVREVLRDSPVVAVTAGPPARLVVTAPSVVRPGEGFSLRFAMLDAVGNAGVDCEGSIELTVPAGGSAPESVALRREDRGVTRAHCVFSTSGVFRISAMHESGISGVSNPVVVSTEGSRIFWGDLHGHSALSDGTSSPREYVAYARDVAGLDVIALTDHDHWGVLFLDQEPELWSRIGEAIEESHEPGRFVTLRGFEWTSWVHGHRHVLYFDEQGEVLSSVDEAYDTPTELWRALRGRNALTFAHHSAGGPVATNWDYPPDPELEPATEVVSVHGSSEAADTPRAIYSTVDANFVRDVLDRGVVFGFVGSGDSHDGHPGLAHLATGVGGVAGILAEELTRDGVKRALSDRRTYATSGPRIVVRFAVDGRPMGSIIEPPEAAAPVFVAVHGTAPISGVDLIRSGRVVASSPGDGGLDLTLATEQDSLRAGEYLYVRVVQRDGGTAWSSPVFVRERGFDETGDRGVR